MLNVTTIISPHERNRVAISTSDAGQQKEGIASGTCAALRKRRVLSEVQR